MFGNGHGDTRAAPPPLGAFGLRLIGLACLLSACGGATETVDGGASEVLIDRLGEDAALGDAARGSDLAVDGGSPRADAGLAPLDAGAPADAEVVPDAPAMAPCEVPAPTACPDPKPTYADDIAPIIERRCLTCHYGEPDGPWPLTSYGHVADWHDGIFAVMLNCAMPPPASGMAMPVAERVRVLEWLRCGLPR